MMYSKKFSIIIPSYNSLTTLGECLESIKKLDYDNYEIIVVDDCSTDGSDIIAEKFLCRFVRLKKNSGPATARNVGAEIANGEILFFTDTDIILTPNTLKLAEIYLRDNSDQAAFMGSFNPKMRFKNLASQYKHLYLCYYYLKQFGKIHTLDTSFTFIKKGIFKEIGGFDSTLGKISEDVDLGMRLVKRGYKIGICRNIEAEHIKYYSMAGFLKVDFIRGKKMSKLFFKSLLKKGIKGDKGFFSLKPINIYINMPLSYLILLILMVGFLKSLFWWLAFAFMILFFINNFNFWKYLTKERNFLFMFKSIFITFIDGLVMGAGVMVSFLSLFFNKSNS